MKIGILTFHDGINYGCFLQVYAMLRWLKDNTEHEVQVINYKDYHHWKAERDYFYSYEIRWSKDLVFSVKRNVKDVLRVLKNYWKIKKFKRCHEDLNLTKFTHTVEGINSFKFDMILVGSDEIWNFDHPLVGYVPPYYGVGIENSKLVSYAGSFGAINAGDKIPQDVIDGMKKFSAISVRDQSSYDIVDASIVKEPSLVVDPVFLHDFSSTEISPNHSNYILVYFANECSEEEIKSMQDYAKKANKKLLAIGYTKSWADINIVDASPFEFLGYLKNADLVFTSMFHGTMFAIKYRVPFCTFSTEYRLNKFGTIMRNLNLEDHLIVDSDYSLDEILGQDINYDEVYAKLDSLTEDSKGYLQTMLNE